MNITQHYFERIGFNGDAKADLQTLKAIHRLHPASIPFENMDVLLNRGVDLNLDTIQKKMLDDKRGGYCFEQNGLLMVVLRSIGFEVEPLMARVLWRQADNAPAGPRTHMVLRVTVGEQNWLVDVGFGGIVLNAPLKFNADEPQATALETFCLWQQPYGYRLCVQLNDQWHPVYDLSTEPQYDIDFEVANWYTSEHPDSKFRHNLMAARVAEDTRYTLLNNRLTIRRQGEKAMQYRLNAKELADALEKYFLLLVEDDWYEVFDKLVETAA